MAPRACFSRKPSRSSHSPEWSFVAASRRSAPQRVGVVIRCRSLTGSDRQRQAARCVWDRHGKSDATRRRSSVAVQVAVQRLQDGSSCVVVAVSGVVVRCSVSPQRSTYSTLATALHILHSVLGWSFVAVSDVRQQAATGGTLCLGPARQV